MLMEQYHIKWNQQSNHAGDCMPLGGRDVGCNVWVEKNILYFYMAQSGAFDEKGNMIKAGRCAVELTPNPFRDSFSQELRLTTGDLRILGKADGVETELLLWVDVFCSVIHLEIHSAIPHQICCRYQNWRQDVFGCSFSDHVEAQDDCILFYHQNQCSALFEERILEESLEKIKTVFPDVQKNRISGGMLYGNGLHFCGISTTEYAGLPCLSYEMCGTAKQMEIQIPLLTAQPVSAGEYLTRLSQIRVENADPSKSAAVKMQNQIWWKHFWNRSYIHIRPENTDPDDAIWQIGRNYQLFRYLLACNAYGSYPTKFNGGLFTIDPSIWGSRRGATTPDERDWGGLEFTAQNQRHIYWPMLKSGDFDFMDPQFAFYLRILPSATARTSHFFGTHDAACFPEQLDANGLSAFYGKDGLDYPIYIRYHYAAGLEFSYMMLKYLAFSSDSIFKADYSSSVGSVFRADHSSSADFVLQTKHDSSTDSALQTDGISSSSSVSIQDIISFADAVLNFYDQAYPEKDENGKRILFPSTAQETYHGAENIDISEAREINYNPEEVAVTNPADLIYALRAVIRELFSLSLGSPEQQKKWKKLLDELPEIPLEVKKGHTVIAPCQKPKDYVKINCEFPQLYGCFPYHEIALTGNASKDLPLARDTYFFAWDSKDQLNYEGWMYSGICAARLGLADEAFSFLQKKLKNAPRRFPAFWGPGFDYTPDHNWGGTGMSCLQEMLLQSVDGKILLLPAWPRDIDVDFKLWIEHNTWVTCSYRNGKLSCSISDPAREADLVFPDYCE